MPSLAFGTPQGTFNPSYTEVVGSDPYDDDDDGTYIRARVDLTTFSHVNAQVVSVGAFEEVPQIIVRAKAVLDNGDATTRMVMNLYGPMSLEEATAGATDPILTLATGLLTFYAVVPNDGLIHDIPVTIRRWDNGALATLAEINDYFGVGGVLLIQPDTRGNTVSTTGANLYVHRISLLEVAAPSVGGWKVGGL